MGSGVLDPLALLEPTIRTRDHRRAGDRDRTGMASLEGWGSTIELRPRAPRWRGRLSLPAARSAA
jgi:hypothetical protein